MRLYTVKNLIKINYKPSEIEPMANLDKRNKFETISQNIIKRFSFPSATATLSNVIHKNVLKISLEPLRRTS